MAPSTSFRLFIALAISTLVLAFLEFLLRIWLLAEMRRWEPETWRSVASPRWLSSRGPAAIRYIQWGQYLGLHSKVRRIGLVLHATQLLLLLLILGFVAFMLWGVLGPPLHRI